MPFELQGHRGARGLKPENTLPSFEAALDIGVSSIETDVHLTRDGVPVLCHDPVLADNMAAPLVSEFPSHERWLSKLTLAEGRRFRVDRNPDPARFPNQNNDDTPVAALYARRHGIDPYGVPTLADLFAFADAYAGGLGEQSGKSDRQRAAAGRLRFDLELKRVPFEPHTIGDNFDGMNAGLLERRVVEEIRRAGMLERTRVRSFDHRSIRAIKQLEPRLTTAVLIADTFPVSPATLAREAGATVYCPGYRFLDESQVRQAREAGLRVIPWTVNRPEDWERLIAWGVDGLTTDYPDQLAAWLKRSGIDVG